MVKAQWKLWKSKFRKLGTFKVRRFFRTFVGKSRIQSLQKMIKGHSVCHKIEVDDSLPGPNFHFLVFKYHANYHRPQSYGGERLQWLENHNFFSTYSTAWPCRFVADKKESIRKKCLNIANDLCSYAKHSKTKKSKTASHDMDAL